MKHVVILVGETRDTRMVADLARCGWGRFWTVATPHPYAGEPWGFDNGAFSAWLHGRAFPADEFATRVERAHAVGVPYIAIAPDLVAGGVASLEFSLGWRERLPDDWPWYLAVQDGMQRRDVRGALTRFTGVFLGGTTRFKATAHAWCEMARALGKRFHYGRAGVPGRIDHAQRIGADSLDSAFPLWTRPRWQQFRTLVTEGDPQAVLPGTELALWRGKSPDGDPITGTTW